LEYVYIMPFSLDMARKELEKGTKRVQI